MTTTNLDILNADLSPSTTLTQSCVDYIKEVDRVIDTDLPAIKTALQNNLTNVQADNRFSADHETEIQGAIDKIDANLAG